MPTNKQINAVCRYPAPQFKEIGLAKFSAGQIVMTRGISNRIDSEPDFSEFIQVILTRHLNCDWGDGPDCDRAQNEIALVDGDRLMSSYLHQQLRTKVWIITEADRSVTTVMFPDEY
jgi:hypothetical protein